MGQDKPQLNKKYTKREWLEIRQRIYLGRVGMLASIAEEREMHAENSERIMAELTSKPPDLEGVMTAMALQAGFQFITMKAKACMAAIEEDHEEFKERGIIWKMTE